MPHTDAAHRSAPLICTSCGSGASGRTKTPGSFWIEVLLWISFIVPGVIYSVWRLTARKRVCEYCSAGTLIPINSPRGRQILAELAPR